jgi:hypothetical protein
MGLEIICQDHFTGVGNGARWRQEFATCVALRKVQDQLPNSEGDAGFSVYFASEMSSCI